MNKEAVNNYIRLTKKLLRDRKVRELSQDEEAERADELDIWWYQMDSKEHDYVSLRSDMIIGGLPGWSFMRRLRWRISCGWELLMMWLDRITGK